MISEIESGIPIPKPLVKSKYPFGMLKVNDSFLVTGKTLNQVRSYSSVIGKKLGMKFKVMEVDGGVRVWRVKPKEV